MAVNRHILTPAVTVARTVPRNKEGVFPVTTGSLRQHCS